MGMFKNVFTRGVKFACLSFALLFCGCSVDIPDDIYACQDDRDCPTDFFCWSTGFCNSVRESCAPRECFSGLCGEVDDGCGGVVDCGDCADGSSCSENLCVQDECEPVECAGLCGEVANQCGNAANCACGIIEDCVEGLCICERDTCESRGKQCGTINTCGETVVCGSCAGGWECQEGTCVCEPSSSCDDVPGFCGQRNNGCETVICGCAEGERCDVESETCVPGVCTPRSMDEVCADIPCGTAFNDCELVVCPDRCPGDEYCAADGADGLGARECQCPELEACGELTCGVFTNSCDERDCGECPAGSGRCEDHVCTCPTDENDAPGTLTAFRFRKFMTTAGRLGARVTYTNAEAITRGDVDFLFLPIGLLAVPSESLIEISQVADVPLSVRTLLTCKQSPSGPANDLTTDCEGAFLPTGTFECLSPTFVAACTTGTPTVVFKVFEPTSRFCVDYVLQVNRTIRAR